MYDRILVPVDGSETSKRGLEEACTLARGKGSRVRCLHVIDEHFLTYNYLGFTYTPELFEALRNNGREVLEEASKLAGDRGVPVESVLRESGGRRVSETILEEARTWPADTVYESPSAET